MSSVLLSRFFSSTQAAKIAPVSAWPVSDALQGHCGQATFRFAPLRAGRLMQKGKFCGNTSFGSPICPLARDNITRQVSRKPSSAGVEHSLHYKTGATFKLELPRLFLCDAGLRVAELWNMTGVKSKELGECTHANRMLAITKQTSFNSKNTA